MTSRLTQLIARYLAVGLTAIAGWIGATGAADVSGPVSDLSAQLAAGIVAVILFAIDLAMHRAATGGVLAHPGQTKPRPKSPYLPLLLLAATLPLASLAGCQATPQQRVLAARESYTAALETLIPLRAAGIIGDDAARKIEAVRVQAAAALDIAEDAAARGDDAGALSALDRFNALLDRLIAAQAQTPEVSPEPGMYMPGSPPRKDTDGNPATSSHRPGIAGRDRWRDAPDRTAHRAEQGADQRRDRGHQGAAGGRRVALGGAAAGVADGC